MLGIFKKKPSFETLLKPKVDLHSHLLPGIDDGARDINEALALALHTVSSGITHAILIPHIQQGRYDNDHSSKH